MPLLEERRFTEQEKKAVKHALVWLSIALVGLGMVVYDFVRDPRGEYGIVGTFIAIASLYCLLAHLKQGLQVMTRQSNRTTTETTK